MVNWSVWPGTRFDLGEGARYVDGRVVLVDILTGRLLELRDGGVAGLAALDCPLGAVAPVDGGWIAAAGHGIAVLTDDGVRWLAQFGSTDVMRMNDGVADPAGRFWAGSMAYDNTPGAGVLHRVDTDGSVAVAVDGLTIPNGPAFTADGATMYLADSAVGVIHRFTVDASGTVGSRELFARVEGTPDGMTVDDEGFVWSAIWGAGRIHRYDPDGALERVLEVPAVQPTSVCLTGSELIVTTAATGLASAGPSDGAVLRAPCAIGAPAARWARLAR